VQIINWTFWPTWIQEEEEEKTEVEQEIESALWIAEKSNELSKTIRDWLSEIEYKKKQHFKKFWIFNLADSQETKTQQPQIIKNWKLVDIK